MVACDNTGEPQVSTCAAICVQPTTFLCSSLPNTALRSQPFVLTRGVPNDKCRRGRDPTLRRARLVRRVRRSDREYLTVGCCACRVPLGWPLPIPRYRNHLLECLLRR